MKIGKYTFTKKEIISIILIYLPLVIYIFFDKSTRDLGAFFASMFSALFFVYPLYLMINFKFKKLIKWFFLGFIPSFFITHFYILRGEMFDLLSLINLSVAISGFMYPMILQMISLIKEYRDFFKELNFIQILFALFMIALMFSRIILNFIRDTNR